MKDSQRLHGLDGQSKGQSSLDASNMSEKEIEAKLDSEINTKTVRNVIKRHFKKRSLPDTLKLISKYLTVISFVALILYVTIMFIMISDASDENFFNYEAGKKFFAVSTCSFPKKILCNYVNIYNDTMMLFLESKYEKHPMIINNVSVVGCFKSVNMTVLPLKKFNISLEGCYDNHKSHVPVEINYKNRDSGLYHTEIGNVRTALEVTFLFKMFYDLKVWYDEMTRVDSK